MAHHRCPVKSRIESTGCLDRTKLHSPLLQTAPPRRRASLNVVLDAKNEMQATRRKVSPCHGWGPRNSFALGHAKYRALATAAELAGFPSHRATRSHLASEYRPCRRG